MRTRRAGIVGLAGLLTLAAMGAGAWVQGRGKTIEAVEGGVKKAALQYYSGMVFGEPESYLAGTRMPLYTVRDGVGVNKDEEASRAMLAKFAASIKKSAIGEDERKKILVNMIGTIEDSSIQFIGANTATLTFLIRADAKSGDESLCTLLLHRADPKGAVWKVIAEVTDSTPVPSAYLNEPRLEPKPEKKP